MNTFPTARRTVGRPQSVSTSDNSRLLELHELWSPEISRPQLLTCAQGRCWITRTGDPTDYLLEPGMTFTVRPSQGVLVQALQTRTVIRTGELP